MTPKQKQWIAALRSGDYEQGTGYLEKDGKFCCLGVACHLFIPELRLGGQDSHLVTYAGRNGVLPDMVTDLLQLRSDTGAIEGFSSHLADMNDEGHTFTEIADFIEANPDKVFR